MAQTLKFYLMTDLHHYGEALGIEGKAFETLDRKEQTCLAETGAIINAYIDKILEDNETDTVLIAGDVSCNGAMESHLDLIPRLRRLKDGGKKVYLITATHDYYSTREDGVGQGKICVGDKMIDATPTPREQLLELYRDFGLSEAIAFHPESHSYCVQLCDGYRLLCLNDDGDGHHFCGYSDDLLEWIGTQIDSAKNAGDYIFAMTHHPALPPTAIYPVFSEENMLGNWDKTTDFLADKGVKFIFTGHTHMHNIARKVTAKGNEFYDINTCSLVGYPTAMRKVVMDDDCVDIKSVTIDSFDWDLKGKSVLDYTREHFEYLLNDIVYSMGYDIDHLANDLAPGFSRTPEEIYKLKGPITFLGKRLNTITLGTVGKLLFIGKNVDKSIKNVKLKDFLLSVVRNVFYGDEPYCPGTPEYKFMESVLNRAKGILRLKKGSEQIIKTLDIVLETLYDAPPSDWEGKFSK